MGKYLRTHGILYHVYTQIDQYQPNLNNRDHSATRDEIDVIGRRAMDRFIVVVCPFRHAPSSQGLSKSFPTPERKLRYYDSKFLCTDAER
jgi:arginine decarboxylase-like protein